MPKKGPYEFQSRTELINLLQSEDTKKHAEYYFNVRLPNIESIVKQSIAANTFRAFQKLPEPPSKVFRDWATAYLHNTIEKLKSIADQKDYAKYVHASALKLSELWRSKMFSKTMGSGLHS